MVFWPGSTALRRFEHKAVNTPSFGFELLCDRCSFLGSGSSLVANLRFNRNDSTSSSSPELSARFLDGGL